MDSSEQVDKEPTKQSAQAPTVTKHIDGKSPEEPSRNTNTAFKLESLGATFASASPEAHLTQEPKLSVTIRGESQRTPIQENAPLQALYIDSGS